MHQEQPLPKKSPSQPPASHGTLESVDGLSIPFHLWQFELGCAYWASWSHLKVWKDSTSRVLWLKQIPADWRQLLLVSSTQIPHLTYPDTTTTLGKSKHRPHIPVTQTGAIGTNRCVCRLQLTKHKGHTISWPPKKLFLSTASLETIIS